VAEKSGRGEQWRVTGFCGDPKRSRRHESWRMMRFLRNQSDLPWLCAGDFNEVLHEHEQFGACEREEWKMEGFWAAVEYAGFTDLGYMGLPYTWDNRRDGRHNVKVRLDRALADGSLLNLFGDSSVQHVQTTEFDHCAVLIHLRRSAELGRHFFNKGLRNPASTSRVYTAKKYRPKLLQRHIKPKSKQDP
jgi:hypothetical protein